MRSAAPLCLILLAAPAGAETIPADFVGSWALSAEACAGGPGAEGFLEITDTQMRFYESVATVQRQEAADGPGRIFEFVFSGEGETWTREMYLEVLDAGATLVRIDLGEPRGIPIAYTACN